MGGMMVERKDTLIPKNKIEIILHVEVVRDNFISSLLSFS